MKKSCIFDVPDGYRSFIKDLLNKPYVVMPGDELRLNKDLIDIVENSDLNFVRVSQYFSKSGTDKLKKDIKKRNFSRRIVVFENINYIFLRFLLQNAKAYAGLVDSSWQPAGWTVACEALASGTPIVMYQGLVSRELRHLGAEPEYLVEIEMGDKKSFGAALKKFADTEISYNARLKMQEFANRELNCELTGADFAAQLELLVS